MIMNNHISLRTVGMSRPEHLDQNTGISFHGFESRFTCEPTAEVNTGSLLVGDIELTIHFADADEIAEFCQRHNIEYHDNRYLYPDESSQAKEAT